MGKATRGPQPQYERGEAALDPSLRDGLVSMVKWTSTIECQLLSLPGRRARARLPYYATLVSQPPPKKDAAYALLERGSLFVHLDPRVDGVVVPAHLRRQPQLVLQVGMNLAVPIPDLEVDDEGVFGTLSFQRTPFYCRIPWSAVFGLVGDDGMGVVWQEDLPSEVADEVAAAEERAARTPALRSIEGGASAPSSPEKPPEPSGGPKRPGLRLVK